MDKIFILNLELTQNYYYYYQYYILTLSMYYLLLLLLLVVSEYDYTRGRRGKTKNVAKFIYELFLRYEMVKDGKRDGFLCELLFKGAKFRVGVI